MATRTRVGSFSPTTRVDYGTRKRTLTRKGVAPMTERDAAEKVVRTPPRNLSMAPKPSGMQLAINRGKPQGGNLVGPTQYDLTTEAFNLVHPQGPAHPDFYDSSQKAFIDSYIRIWNFVDYFKNRPGPNTVNTPNAPLRSLGVPFGEGAGEDHLWPVLSDEGCKMSYIDVNGNSDGELLARFGAARPSQGWTSNRYHIGTDVIARGGDIVIAPEVPLARPHGMAVYEDHLLISDMFSHRIVRCQLEFKDSSQVDLPH